MKNKITIIGAGMAGLLAANMLRRHDLQVLEKSSSLPENHSALLRFRTSSVSDATGIPFQKVTIDKGLWDGMQVVNKPTLAHANAYSINVTGGEVQARSVRDLSSDVRYIAPIDFVEQMARHVPIKFGTVIDKISESDHPIISTAPMPVMMNMSGWKEIPEFNFQPIWTVKAFMLKPWSKVYQTLYNVRSDEWYRATIHGQELTLEYPFDPSLRPSLHMDCVMALKRFFNHCGDIKIEYKISVQQQKYGKITAIPEDIRQAFILWLTDKYNIFSLGRFATWRPLLLDDLVKDIKHIEAIIQSGNNYKHKLQPF